MIPDGDLVLLDTNVFVHLIRGNELGDRIDREYQLRARTERPLVSIVTVGELRSLAKKWSWGQGKVARLMDLVRQCVVVDIGSEPILHWYAEIDHMSESQGRPMGKNDVWIAATAAAAGAWLLSGDRDFEHLASVLRYQWIAGTGSRS